MKSNQTIVRMVAALVIAFGVETTANAQLGKLKGLADKTKKTVTEKAKETVSNAKKDATTSVHQQASSAASAASSAVGGSISGSSANVKAISIGNLTVELPAAKVDYSVADKCEWDQQSSAAIIVGDLAYHMKRVRESLKGGLNGIDFDSYAQLSNHFPTFRAMLQVRQSEVEGAEKANLLAWKDELDAVVGAIQETINGKVQRQPGQSFQDGAFDAWSQVVRMMKGMTTAGAKQTAFDVAETRLEASARLGWISERNEGYGDLVAAMKEVRESMSPESRGLYPTNLRIEPLKAYAEARANELSALQENSWEHYESDDPEYQKMELKKLYEEAAKDGRYKTMPASKGNAVEKMIIEFVKESRPVWGKVIRASHSGDGYTVHKNALGVPVYKACASWVLCEIDGYKVMRDISVRREYTGGGNYGPERLMLQNANWDKGFWLVK